MKAGFKRNLLIGYGASLILLIGSAAASYISINNLLSSSRWVNHTNEVLRKLENIISVLKDAETGQRGYLLTDDERFLESYNGAYDKSLVLLNQTKQLTADNPQQQVNCDLLHSLITKRLGYLQTLIDRKRNGEPISKNILVEGKTHMDSARRIVDNMQAREQTLLGQRTANLNRFSTAVPALIVVASVLAVLITLISFFRVLKDYANRLELQQSLQHKDEETTKRIAVVQTVADQIAAGDYSLKIDDVGMDSLGAIAVSLNKMAQALDASFSNLKDREWQQRGIAELNELMIGEKNEAVLTAKVIQFITAYTRAQVGAFWLAKDGKTLQLASSLGLNRSQVNDTIGWGEAVAGQAAMTGKEVLLENITGTKLLIDYSGGSFQPRAIIAMPIFYETRLKGVLELAMLQPITALTTEFLKTASFNIGIAIHSVRDHQRLQELLMETQAQSEELQAQHSELENVNAELQAQAEKLQTSEEELRVQQEELQQANQELEERTRSLEDKNELILQRNFEVQQKAEELALSTKYKSEFLANMSHELRTPLNSILLLSRLLSENHGQNLSTDQIEYANVIQSSGKGLLTLIDEILDLSKIEAGKMELEYSAVDIADVTNELRSLFAPLAKEKNILFQIELQNGLPAVIESDRLRVEQILRNLLSNALKFTKQGAVTLQVANEKDAVRFTVKDTGIGIPVDKQQTIFEAFQQADGSTRRQFGGTGLGLSISRELARLLGGEIQLQSEEGKGSAFTLLLPVQKGQAAPVKKEVDAMPVIMHEEMKKLEEAVPNPYVSDAIPPSVPDDRETVSKEDKTILIIEDDTAFARSLLDFTRQKGYKGLVAVRGDEGVELAKRFLPMGILLDIQLPVKSGWDVMDELKAHPATRPIPVHMMSSLEAKAKSLAKGAVDFINKPVAFEKVGAMFQKIEEALSRDPKKVLILEENPKHAQALAYFLEQYNVHAEIKNTIHEGIDALNQSEVDCVILDMGIPAQRSYDVIEEVKKTPGYENLPIIVFTGKNLSHVEEAKIRQYADSIVVKTAHSYQRILDEVSLFLHLVEDNKKSEKTSKYKRMGALGEVLKGKTVLVADDDVRNIFSLTRSLENYGVNVISAIDGKDALQQLEQNGKVDLVLMDMMMPEMDGYDSTRRIREHAKWRNLPVIAVTAKAMTGDREKCMAAGASDYITKPVDVDQLISLLRVWLYE